ncbi:hypothetical protein NDU88_001156 [Pleurodeles waltl]|uniref:Uncharacterized protein n=1 Tax=Pleurodeles waltl TaxID=8319 RepID=A0AAV7V9K8_PLEWA|nr:hypothetical protein NDU88_001156 [Pleurodeles waltl]
MDCTRPGEDNQGSLCSAVRWTGWHIRQCHGTRQVTEQHGGARSAPLLTQAARRKAPERPPNLAPGEFAVRKKDNMVSVTVEVKEPNGCGEAHLRKGVYVLDA